MVSFFVWNEFLMKIKVPNIDSIFTKLFSFTKKKKQGTLKHFRNNYTFTTVHQKVLKIFYFQMKLLKHNLETLFKLTVIRS